MYIYICLYESKSCLYDTDIGLVRPDGHPRTYRWPGDGDDDGAMLQVVEGKLARITHDVPTLRMERIPISM